MGKDTKIEWTDHTWNPVTGCQKVSQGCKYCYAKTIAERFQSEDPTKNLAFPNGFDYTERPKKLNFPKTIEGSQKIFVNSMSDLFWDKITPQFFDKIMEVIRSCPQHQFQVLTKRADRLYDYAMNNELPANFWAGVTIENQATLETRLPLLLSVPAKIRFISFEPLLEDLGVPDLTGVDWCIVGGESGGHLLNPLECWQRALVYFDTIDRTWKPYPDRVQWVENLRQACEASNVAFFFKQWGGLSGKSAGNLLNGKEYLEFPDF